jgi:hypothetical protein
VSPVVALGAGYTNLTVRYLNSVNADSYLTLAFRMGGSENFTTDGSGVFYSSLQQWCVTFHVGMRIEMYTLSLGV